MNLSFWVAPVPRTAQVIELAMPGVKAKVAEWHKVHLVPALIRVVNYMLMASNLMNEYPVYPEQNGEEDRKLNPYAPV
jgi:hypothetical protein